MPDFVVQSSPGLKGTITLPGDKSVSHRSVLLSAIAEGSTVINGFLTGEDTVNTAKAVQCMGITVEGVGAGRLTVHGKGLDGLHEPEGVLDLGNSGTGMRLIAGLLAGQGFFSVLTGDRYLRKRPMGRIVEPLRRMGARIDGRSGGKLAPLAITGSGRKTAAIDFSSPVASAQVKSALLLAGLYADGETAVSEPSKSRDHTERMLRFFGVEVGEQGNRITLRGRQALHAGGTIEVPSDISSAAFFMVAASIVPGSDLRILNVGVNPTRTGIIDVLISMGGDIVLENTREQAGEPVADIRVRSKKLHGVRISGDVIPRAIDEIPVLCRRGLLRRGNYRNQRRGRTSGQGVRPDSYHGAGAEKTRRGSDRASGRNRNHGQGSPSGRDLRKPRRPSYRHVHGRCGTCGEGRNGRP